MRIYLIGFMGSGKSSLGKILAHKLNYAFVDLDDIIEEKAEKKITDIFKDDGEQAFRSIEQECLAKTFSFTNTVIATGGGTPCFFDNMEMMNQNGISVYLKFSSGILASRLFDNPGERPLLAQHKSKQDLKNYIDSLLKDREQFYNNSKLIVEGKINLKKIVELINENFS